MSASWERRQQLAAEVRQEAAGMTLEQVEAKAAAAMETRNHSVTNGWTFDEWYAIAYVMRGDGDGLYGPGMDVYDPQQDRRPQ